TLSVTDIDGDHLASATVAVSGSFSGSGDNLFVLDGATHLISGTFGSTNITVSETTDGNGNETLTLSGYDTITNYEAALDAVQFLANGDNPTDSGTHTARTFTWTVSDGASGNPIGPNTATTFITIDAVNDAPSNTAPAATLTVNEDTSLAFTAGNTISVSDPDNQSLTVT